MTALTTSRLRRARVGVLSAFFVAGFVTAVWVVNIPGIQAQTGIDTTTLGLDILVFGIGSVLSMQITGRLMDRVGSWWITLGGAVVLVLAINLPPLTANGVALGVALFVMGLGNGALDLAMNHHAVLLQQR